MTIIPETHKERANATFEIVRYYAFLTTILL